MIRRFKFWDCEDDDEGDGVWYDDHIAALKEARNSALIEAAELLESTWWESGDACASAVRSFIDD